MPVGVVFVRNDAPRAPLQQPYEGPFPVVQRCDKTFLVRIHGRTKHISLDRLKPTYLINDQVDPQDRDPQDDPVIIPQREETAAPRREPEPTPAAPGPVRTRSGRRVRFPGRYQTGFLCAVNFLSMCLFAIFLVDLSFFCTNSVTRREVL
ncbi:hypothetical protein NQ318_018456 [Aromia moschata]|uniref:Uncharacterized protein n=1 Tax=Aromia moschata TaxID=1265417 RepID=A0AAV8YKH6_9CUCU|nr:hypothetical protein NQ318_018456 [Aromia moschata]